jgi:DNA-binding CsgD family transcriptional regulator
MTKMINHYDNIMKPVFEQGNTNHKFNLEKDLPKLIAQYEKIVKPDFLFVINMHDVESRLAFEKNYTLKSDKGEVNFEMLMSSIPKDKLGELMEVDSISAMFAREFFKEPFQYLMNVGIPVELITGKPQYLLRTGTVMSFDKNGIPDYVISTIKDMTPLTCAKKNLNYYISYGDKPAEELKVLSEKFDELLKNEIILSRQEKKILLSVKEGKTSQDIASGLFISKSTVDTHRQNIIRKFKVKNTNEAIQKAVDLGFFD